MPPSESNPGSSNGNGHAEGVSSVRRGERVAALFAPLSLRGDQLTRLAETPGAADDPWDVLLSTTATDEHAALEAVAQRYGVPF